MEPKSGSTQLLVWAVLLLASLLVEFPAARAESATRFFPEFDGFFNLDDRSRLMLMAADRFTEEKSKNDNETESRTEEVGANLDFTLMPVLRTELREADWERDRYLWMRVGYTYLGKSNGWSGGESRGTLELNARQPFGDGFWLMGRLKWDMRDIDGDYSNRYRVRIGIENEMIVAGRKWVPYVDAESFYDTRYDVWNRQYYRTGVEILVSKQWRIEPYLGYQFDNRSEPEHIYVVGLIFKYAR